jgi:hypothetical protein
LNQTIAGAFFSIRVLNVAGGKVGQLQQKGPVKNAFALEL